VAAWLLCKFAGVLDVTGTARRFTVAGRWAARAVSFAEMLSYVAYRWTKARSRSLTTYIDCKWSPNRGSAKGEQKAKTLMK